jgi:hypothetical protein
MQFGKDFPVNFPETERLIHTKFTARGNPPAIFRQGLKDQPEI